MPSGGARARSGPAPDPNALRRDKDAGSWLTLPAGGRDGDVPEWPLSIPAGEARKLHERELVLWEALWGKPQAVAWEKFGLEYEVAMLVRRMAEAEQPGSHTSTGTLVRQMMDSLGLTVPGMDRNKWRLSDDELAEQRSAKPAGGSRSRLKVAKAADGSGA